MSKYTLNEIEAAEGILNIIPLYQKKKTAISLIKRLPSDVSDNIIHLLSLILSYETEEQKVTTCQKIFKLLDKYPNLKNEFKEFIKDSMLFKKIDL
tara:strand:- start:520 stop:807 length:288 start_codon:yes stop_codon:yes gene_type:complete